MQQVKDLVLYQIATDRHFKVWDKIHFGKEDNRLAQRVYNARSRDGKPLAKLGYDYLSGRSTMSDKQIVSMLSNAMAENDLAIRELATEEVRKRIAPKAPSRFKCMFLTTKKENVLESLSHFSVYTTGDFFQGVAVKLNGTIFVAQTSIGRSGLSYNEYSKLAEDYWKQKSSIKDDPAEVLFVGDAEIVEVFKEIERPKDN